ncbi:MAG TPA: hypothetical protein VNK23_12240 [Candidatus Dormibacteraeota bacterium]|nr:hypothetical protein [Candidatus Dormibacteraeota bacterium]
MPSYVHRRLVFFVVLLFGAVALAQQPSQPAQSPPNIIRLNVVAAHKSGSPVTGMQ